MSNTPVNPKRPCPNSPEDMSPLLTNDNSKLNQIITHYQKIEKPEIKDMFNFMASFLIEANNLDGRVKNVEKKVMTVEARCDIHEERMDNIEERLNDFEESQKSLERQADHNTSNILYIQQQLLSKEIILKNFPTKPDPDTVIKNFCDVFAIDLRCIKEYYYVSYTRTQQTQQAGSSAQNSKLLHFVVIAFKTKSMKVDVFKKKSKRGSLVLKELLPDTTDNKETIIKCTNKLTKFNLYAQKVLYKALDLKLIHQYRFHNNLFQIKAEENSKWFRMDSFSKVKDFDQQPRNITQPQQNI